jgi:hypothetical protein
MTRSLRLLAAVAVAAAACATPTDPADSIAQQDLPLGDAPQGSSSGGWGYALQCKPVPSLPSLSQPQITVSIEGLTLHLVDPASGYDKVFPIGPGAIENDPNSPNYGESKTYEPLLANPSGDFAITPSSIQPCKTWWTDPATGQRSPVFAGLPFMSWNGAYAVHGPIDNFRAANGGNLRRGFVSHGCVRMEAADVLEVYARIKSVASTPVHVQREPERAADGTRVDVPAKWIGAECGSDGDCNFSGGVCKFNAFAQRGFCTAHCSSTCTDRAGQPTTTCVADPDDATSGICIPRMNSQNQDCRPYDHLVARTLKRFKRTSTALVCVPGSPGWVGDHCFADGDCRFGASCAGANGTTPGMCTQSCDQFCPDQPGWTTTMCATDDTLGTTCLRRCTPASNASECAGGESCQQRTRPADGSSDYVCVPQS